VILKSNLRGKLSENIPFLEKSYALRLCPIIHPVFLDIVPPKPKGTNPTALLIHIPSTFNRRKRGRFSKPSKTRQSMGYSQNLTELLTL